MGIMVNSLCSITFGHECSAGNFGVGVEVITLRAWMVDAQMTRARAGLGFRVVGWRSRLYWKMQYGRNLCECAVLFTLGRRRKTLDPKP